MARWIEGVSGTMRGAESSVQMVIGVRSNAKMSYMSNQSIRNNFVASKEQRRV